MRSVFYLLFISSFAPLVHPLDPSASVSIDQLPAWSYQRTCGKGCLQNTYDNGDDIEKELGCTWNGCYCGNQYQSAATSIIKSCWSAYCGTAIPVSDDISTALSIYNDYCGGGAAATTTVVESGGTDSTAGTTVYITHLTVVTAVQTASSLPTASSPSAVGSGGTSLSASCKLLLFFYMPLIVTIRQQFTI